MPLIFIISIASVLYTGLNTAVVNMNQSSRTLKASSFKELSIATSDGRNEFLLLKSKYNFDKTNVNGISEDITSQLNETKISSGNNRLGEANSAKALNSETAMLTKGVVKLERVDYLSPERNQLFSINLNDNYNWLGGLDNSKKFEKIRIFWGEPNSNQKLQITMLEQNILTGNTNDAYDFLEKRVAMSTLPERVSREFSGIQNMSGQFNSEDSDIISKYEQFDKYVVIGPDLTNSSTFDINNKLYTLNLELIGNTAVPFMIEALNSNGKIVEFTGEKTLKADSSGVTGNISEATTLKQNLGRNIKKYFNKNLFIRGSIQNINFGNQ